MSKDEERLRILEMIDTGLITADEGIVLLKALAERNQALPEETVARAEGSISSLSEVLNDSLEPDKPSIQQTPAQEEIPSIHEPLPSESEAIQREVASQVAAFVPEPTTTEEQPIPEEPPVEERPTDPLIRHWRSWWWIPVWVGVFITVLGALFMFLSFRSGGLGFWFACSWFPFLLGVTVLALAWASRNARWLHVRIHQKEGERPQNINISVPIPLRLSAWFIRTFGSRIPNLNHTGLDEVILALEKTSPDAPFYVQVNEGEDGEKVEVYIG